MSRPTYLTLAMPLPSPQEPRVSRRGSQLPITSAVHDAPGAGRQLGGGVSGAFPKLPVLVPAPVAAAGRVT